MSRENDFDYSLLAVFFHFTGYLLYIVSALSITAGAHRLWSHRSYKARLPLRIMLMMFNFVAGQVSRSASLQVIVDIGQHDWLTW